MSRQAKTLPPRWRTPAPAGPVISVSKRRHARMMAREFAKATGRRDQAEMQAGVLATTNAYRWRRQLVPFWLLGGIAGPGEACYLMHNERAALVALAPATAMFLLTRGLKRFGKRAGIACACLTGLWVPVVALLGIKGPAGALLLLTWAPLAVAWVRHYRVRPGELPELNRDHDIWERLAEHKRWSGRLGEPEKIPGGLRYPLVLDGVKTHIGDVLGQPLSIAAAWDKPVTEAYVERSPDGSAKRGSLTLLTHGTLQAVRYWDGSGVTEEGFATIGRFADGSNTRIRVFAPMDGTRHSLIAGTTGAGKTELLNLLLHVYLTSGFIYPIVLDPQEGQSLPDWQDQVPYAAGVDQCMEMLTLVHQMMFSRSRRLSQMTWNSDGHVRRMSFFDRHLTGWPAVKVIGDEMPMLLTGEGRAESKRAEEAIALVKDMGKLGRKTGTGIDLVTQVPSLEELGSTVLRSMLRGGNVICLRTADRVSAGMLGLPADPHDIPQYFPNGDFTYGLGYALGPDRREAIARTDIPTAEQRRRRYEAPALEWESAQILGRFGTALSLPSPAASQPLAAVPASEEGKPGQTAADAVLAVLDREMTKGEIMALCRPLVMEQWGRPAPFHLKTFTLALASLTEDGQITKTGHGTYAPVRPSLSVVGGSPRTTPERASR